MKKFVIVALMTSCLGGVAFAKSAPKPAVAIGHDSWIKNSDYPSSAVAQRAEGVVEFQIGITPEGLPENCIVRRSSGFKILDEATCNLILQRARFRPALDQEGKPTEGGYRDRVIWTGP